VIGMLLRWWVTYTNFGRTAARSIRTLSPLRLLGLLLPSLMLLVWIERASDYRHWIWFTVFEVAIVLAAAPALIYASRPVREALRWPLRGLAWLGERSYGIYLWHFPVILFVFNRGPLVRPPAQSHLWLRVIAAAALTVVLGSLSYRLVEVPGRAAGRRLARSLRPADPPAPPVAAATEIR
jgi:peptidoglycan/LPS O-acetylase OafA/YrhL